MLYFENNFNDHFMEYRILKIFIDIFYSFTHLGGNCKYLRNIFHTLVNDN